MPIFLFGAINDPKEGQIYDLSVVMGLKLKTVITAFIIILTIMASVFLVPAMTLTKLCILPEGNILFFTLTLLLGTYSVIS